jgi:pimeloyl-ACP methyl ester carboxylesterase
MKVYTLPGLGYDHQIFSKLRFGKCNVKHWDWIEPLKSESIQSYATRISHEITEGDLDLVLVGHSFGGVVAQEIAAQKKLPWIILIGSVTSRAEIPIWLKMLKPLRISNIITTRLAIKTFFIWGRSHDFRDPEHLSIFEYALTQLSDTYLQWALRAISQWTPPRQSSSTKIYRIHGTSDETFAIKRIAKPDFTIEGGSHIALFVMPQKVQSAIDYFLAHVIKY